MATRKAQEEARDGKRALDEQERRDEHREPGEQRLEGERPRIVLTPGAKEVEQGYEGGRAEQVTEGRTAHGTSVDRWCADNDPRN